MKKLDFKLFLIFIIYIIIAHFGFELWDTGYITSFSWKILQGEIPYKEFIYKGPPVTLYFNSFIISILPIKFQFLALKIINYVFFGLQVLLFIKSYQRLTNDLTNYKLTNIWIVCFCISILNFTPYPWPTTDGLFFAAIALFILTHYKSNFFTLFFVSLFVCLSSLTKQSYYLIPILFGGLIYFKKDFSSFLKFLFITLFIIVFYFFVLWNTGVLEYYLDQTTKETGLEQLIYSGFIKYLWLENGVWNLPLVLIFIIFLGYSIIIFRTFKFDYLKKLALFVIIYSFVLIFIKDFFIASKIFYVGIVILVLSKFNINILKFLKENCVYIFYIGIAWCCSISLGYSYPILFSTGLILVFISFFKNNFFEKILIYKYFVFVLVIMSISYNYKPYRENNITKLYCNLNIVSDKLANIYTNKENLEKLLELKNLIKKTDKNYLVAPNIPMVHYIFDTKSILPADWIINSEINQNPNLFLDKIYETKPVIFIEKSFVNSSDILMPKAPKDFSLVTVLIMEKFKKTGETKYFYIYNFQ